MDENSKRWERAERIKLEGLRERSENKKAHQVIRGVVKA